jgi:hypothetical protein
VFTSFTGYGPGTWVGDFEFTDSTLAGTITFTQSGITGSPRGLSGTVGCGTLSFGITDSDVEFSGALSSDGSTASGSYTQFSPYLDTGSWSGTASGELPLVSVGDAYVLEGDVGSTQIAYVPVTLSKPWTSAVSVQYLLIPPFSGAAATSDVDYVQKTGTVKFAPAAASGVTPVTKWIAVTVLPDEVDEADERVYAVIGNAVGGRIGRDTGAVTIADFDDTDPGVQLAIGAGSIAEGDSGRRTVKVTVSLSRAAASTVTLEWATGDGSASAPFDYIPKSGTVTFTPGQTRKVITIPVIADDVAEPEEAFSVYMLSMSGSATFVSEASGITIIEE